MKRTIILLTLLVLSIAVDDDAAFKEWKKTQGKVRASKDVSEAEERKNFKENSAAINEHNKNPNATYKKGHNVNSGLPSEEINKSNENPLVVDKRKGRVKTVAAATSPGIDPKVKAAFPTSLDYSK